MRFLSLFSGVFRCCPSTTRIPAKPFGFREYGVLNPIVHNKVMEEPFDWRKHGVISSVVRDQGFEHTCTSFAVIETVQAAHFIATGESVLLSPRDLSMNIGCRYFRNKTKIFGGDSYLEDAFSFIEHKGIMLEKECPYLNKEIRKEAFKGGNIERVGRLIFIDFYEITNDEKSLLRVLKTQPVAAEVLVDGSFDDYKEGIYRPNFRNPTLPHAMTIIGWGKCPETGEEYYIVKNSMGKEWGQGGYGMLLKDSACGFINSGGYPMILKGCIREDKGERNYARDRLSLGIH